MTDPVTLENPPIDSYDPAWPEWNRRHPGPRSVGAAAAGEGEGEEGASEGGAGEGGEGEAGEAGTVGAKDTALGGDKTSEGGGDKAPTDWRADLPDDLKEWSKKFTSREAALKSHKELESRLGKSVVLPGENATPEEIAEFRKKALGVPESPDGYEIKLPDDLPDELKTDEDSVKERMSAFAQAMHEAGAPPAAVQAASDFYHKMLVESLEQQAQALQAASEAAVAELDREWGADKQANDTYALRVIKQFDRDGRFKEFANNSVTDGVPTGNHPEFRRMFAEIGRAMAEDRAQMNPTEEETQSVEAEINRVRKDKEEALRTGDRATAQRLDREERALWERVS